MKKIIFWTLLILSSLLFFREILIHKEDFLTPYNPLYWEKRYLNSQWVKGWEAKEKLGDAELYAYAGWRQIKGDDPTKINPEVPPLGKYLIGLSILIFGNPLVISPIFGIFFLVIIFLLGKEILKDNLWAIIPVFIISLDPLFRKNLTISMLDLPFSLFIALSFYFLLRGKDNPRFYFFSVLSLAATATTKFYLVGFALIGVFIFYLLLLLILKKRKDIFWFLRFLPIFAIFYFLVYLRYFLSGHSLGDFKYLHFWIRHFARVRVENYLPGEILRILLLGKWKTWWDEGGIIKVSEWRPWWPLGFGMLIISFFESFLKRDLRIFLLVLWSISLLGMFFWGVPYPRYLLPILPPLYILVCYNLKRLVFR